MLGVASSHQENLLYFPAGWEGPEDGSDIPPLDSEGDSLDEEGGGTLLTRLGHYPGPEFPDQVEAFLPPVATGLDGNWDENGAGLEEGVITPLVALPHHRRGTGGAGGFWEVCGGEGIAAREVPNEGLPPLPGDQGHPIRPLPVVPRTSSGFQKCGHIHGPQRAGNQVIGGVMPRVPPGAPLAGEAVVAKGVGLRPTRSTFVGLADGAPHP